jgi:peptide/nickel transport system permease protein
VAVIVGLSTVTICAVLGVALGAVSGYFGGWIDEILMRATEILMAFPGILLAILIIFVTQEPGLPAVVGALTVTGWASYARLVRGQVLSERERPYVEAARALGFPSSRIIFREILPNVMAPVIVQATFGLAGAILAEASLSFLGLGAQNTPSWGALLDQGASYFLLTPHLAIFPGLAIMITVLGMNLLGDGLRDLLDVRTDDR